MRRAAPIKTLRLLHYLVPALCTLYAACARYEYVRPDCPKARAQPFHSAIAWQQTANARVIAGRIFEIHNADPARNVQVLVGSAAGRRIYGTDALGAVRIDSAPVGMDTLLIRSLQHGPISTTLRVTADSGVEFVAALELLPPTTPDECGLIRERRLKPWWKLW